MPTSIPCANFVSFVGKLVAQSKLPTHLSSHGPMLAPKFVLSYGRKCAHCVPLSIIIVDLKPDDGKGSP